MSKSNPVTIVLADDHVMVRESLARVLNASGEIQVVGQVTDGNELHSAVESHQPRCLVLDYSMPNHNPIETIKQLVKRFRMLKILVLTVHESIHYAVRTLQAGAHGYLIKSAAVDELVDAICHVDQGEVYLSKKIAPEVWTQLWKSKGSEVGLDALSPREFEVLRLIGSGTTLQDCAKQLDVSVSSVSTYRRRILEKLNLSSTSDIIRYAIEHNATG